MMCCATDLGHAEQSDHKLCVFAHVLARRPNQMIVSPFCFIFAMNKSQVANVLQIIDNSFISLHAFVYSSIVTSGTQ